MSIPADLEIGKASESTVVYCYTGNVQEFKSEVLSPNIS